MIIFFLITFFLVPNETEQARIQIASVGCFHDGEMDVDSSLPWYGLFADASNSGTYHLKKVKLQLDTCYDVILDAPGEFSGTKITIDIKDQYPVLLIGGLKLKEHEIKTFPEYFKTIFPGETVPVYTEEFRNQYRLHAYGTAKPYDSLRLQPWVDDYRVVCEKPVMWETDMPLKQEIISAMLFTGDENRPSLAWYGDIDGDTVPDYIFNLTNHYNVSHMALYLSSAADKGQIVKLVAEYRTTGC